MKTWFTIIDGRIDRIQIGEAPAGEGEWHSAAADLEINHGDKVEWFDEAMNRISEAELVRQGKRVDNRGKVYNTNDQSTRTIYDLDDPLGEDETKEPPIENEPFQLFDKTKAKWVVDIKKKNRAEKENVLTENLEKIKKLG